MQVTHAASALAGGILIGLSATLLLLLNGRIAGISGIFNGALRPRPGDTAWRLAFLTGLVLGTVLHSVSGPAPIPFLPDEFSPALMVAGGLLVGFGTRLGSGCTSGHGVCGIARFSVRSLAATITFVLTGMISVFLVRHVLGLGAGA